MSLHIAYLALFSLICVHLTACTSPGPVPRPYKPWPITWPHLDYDPEDYMCAKFSNLCDVFLNEIDCTKRVVEGCKPDLLNFKPVCKCEGDPVFIDKGLKIANSITDNRIKPEVGWMLEPWSSGPPYNFQESYVQICMLTLKRIGCNTTAMQIEVGSNDGVTKNKCACGTAASNYAVSQRIEDLMTDKMTEAVTMKMPIFEDPIVLNVQLSMAILFIVGKLFSIVANFFRIPTVIGFILAGMAIIDIVNPGLIKGCGGRGPKTMPFAELRNVALVILLMRAGITLKPREVFGSNDYLMIAIAFVPYLCEWSCGVGAAMTLLGWNVNDAGLMMSILSALSPSIVIPGMIKGMADGLGYMPKIVLSAAPFEVVLSVIMFNIFTNILQSGPDPVMPWVQILPLWANIILIPVNIGFSCVLGFVVGRPVSMYFNWRKSMSSDEKWGPTLNRILPESGAEYLLVCLTLSYTLFALCTKQYIQQSNGILAIFVMMLTISSYAPEEISKSLGVSLAGLWTFFEVILFTTVGCGFAYRNYTGPLQSNQGLTPQAVSDLSKVVFLGSLGRFGGLIVLVFCLRKFLPDSLQNYKSLSMIAVTIYFSQLPKATIQAVLGGVPLSSKIIPGQIGYKRGIFIQQASTLSILIFATIGIVLTNYVALPFAEIIKNQIAAGNSASTAKSNPEFSKIESGETNTDEKVVELTAIQVNTNSAANPDLDAKKTASN